jgi:DNA-binding transcriptional ArsR family regulator
MKKQESGDGATFFSALADPIRLGIITTLIKQDKCLCVCDLAPMLERDQSVVYRHLVILHDAGIVSLKKHGKYLHCCIHDKRRVQLLLSLQGDIMEKNDKKGFISKLLDEADEKMEKKSEKQCCGKGGCCE